VAKQRPAVQPPAPKDEIEERIGILRRMIVTCEWNESNAHAVQKKLMERWGVSDRTIREYARVARREIGAVTRVDPADLDTYKRIALARVEYTYEAAMAARQYKAAVEAQDLWCQITGVKLYERLREEREANRERRDAEKHARDMGAVGVREVVLVVEESPAPKEPGGSDGA